MTSYNTHNYTPLLAFGIAWFIFSTIMSRSLGFLGVIFDYIYILTVAMFSSYLPRSRTVFLLGLWVSYYYFTYFTVVVPSMNYFMPASELNNTMIVAISQYVLTPFMICIAVVAAYFSNKFLIKHLKLRERIGKVINT